MSIRNYTTQTNSHKGYTIEELKRLFGKGKEISYESLAKLISECFNYELVSGEGIRILELKNNDYKSNTTKTYKIECIDTRKKSEGSGSGTGSGSGSGSGHGCCKIYTDKGVTWDSTVDDTVIANLYDYTLEGSPQEEGVFPVSLSVDGKLIVNTIKADISVTARANTSTAEYINDIYRNHFTFVTTFTGRRINADRIETWIEEDGVEIIGSRYTYPAGSPEVVLLNTQRSLTLYRDCPGYMDLTNPNRSIRRTGCIKVYYTLEGANMNRSASASTIFMHRIYYGYTGRYMTTYGNSEISPERRQTEPNVLTQPYFKIYSSNPSVYINGTRTGLEVEKDSNLNYNLRIYNTEKQQYYVLGNFDVGQHTKTYLPSSRTFSITGLGNHQNLDVFICILIPVSMTRLMDLMYTIDSGSAYSCLEAMIIENTEIKDWTYYNDGVRYVSGIKYVAYTLHNSFSTYVNNYIRLDGTVQTL